MFNPEKIRIRRMAFLVLFTIIIAQPLLSLSLQCVDADPDIIHVPDDYTTIQEAIDAAADGDTIIVRYGIYKEDYIRIRKKLSIVR